MKKLKLSLLLLTIFASQGVNAYWLNTVTDVIKNNKIASCLAMTTALCGFVGYTLYKKNAELGQKIEKITNHNKLLMKIKKALLTKNGELDQINRDLKRSLCGRDDVLVEPLVEQWQRNRENRILNMPSQKEMLARYKEKGIFC